MLAIDTAGYPVTTSGLNAINIRYQGGAAAIEGTAVRVDAIPGSTTGGIWNSYRILQSAGAGTGIVANGVKFDNVTPAGGTDNMIYGGTGWDSIINYNGTKLITGTGSMNLVPGTATVAPMILNRGSLLTAQANGAFEHDTSNTMLYFTNNTTNGRGYLPVTHFLKLNTDSAALGAAIADVFGTNAAIPLVANGVYEIEFEVWWTKTTAGTVTWTITNSTTVTSMTVNALTTPVAGYTAVPTASAVSMGGLVAQTAAAAAFSASASVTTATNHWTRFRILLENGASTSLRLRVTSSAGTVTPRRGSFWKATRVANTGIYIA